MDRKKFTFIISTLLIILLFVTAEVLAFTYSTTIQDIVMANKLTGELFFVGMAALAVIVPVWSNIFLLPFGVIAWGPFMTSLLCITGWWIGSVVAFFIARTYREKILIHKPSLTTYTYIDTLISKKHPTLTLIFLRMTLPVDILSYALGLFSGHISWKQNALTTLIGITPFAFIFSYIGTFSGSVQIIILSTTTLLFFFYYLFRKKLL